MSRLTKALGWTPERQKHYKRRSLNRKHRTGPKRELAGRTKRLIITHWGAGLFLVEHKGGKNFAPETWGKILTELAMNGKGFRVVSALGDTPKFRTPFNAFFALRITDN